MRLIFIRHGDPDYSIDNLTEKGKREVEQLTKRVCSWKNITAFYTSPLGRARATGEPSLKKLERQAQIFDWLQEFPNSHLDKNGNRAQTWDLPPEFYCSNQDFFHKDNWCKNDYMGPEIQQRYKEVCNGIDGLLQEYGYIRTESGLYTVENPTPNHNWNKPIEKYHLKSVKEDYPQETTLVFFCHLGVMFTIIGHLTGISPVQLWQGFYVAPTSVTILNSEERTKGQAWFRVERLGDTKHLTTNNEPISSSGYFASVFPD